MRCTQQYCGLSFRDFIPIMTETINRYFGGMKPSQNLPELNFQPEQPITSPIVKEVVGPEAENVTLAEISGSKQ